MWGPKKFGLKGFWEIGYRGVNVNSENDDMEKK